MMRFLLLLGEGLFPSGSMPYDSGATRDGLISLVKGLMSQLRPSDGLRCTKKGRT